MNRRISWPAFILVCAVAVLLRVVWAAFVHAVPVSDFAYYYGKAVALASGQGYTNNGVPTAFWPPGYPIFLSGILAVFGKTVAVAKYTSIALWVVTTGLAYMLGLRMGGRSSALAAGLIVALFPDFILFANLTSSENLFIPLAMASLLVLSSDETLSAEPSMTAAIVAGLLLGAAIIVRTTAVLFPALVVLILLVRFRSRRVVIVSVAFVLAVAVPIVPWMVRNQIVMGSPVLSTNGGISLYTGNNPLATGGFAQKGPLPNTNTSTPAEELASSSVLTHEALAFILTKPVQFIKLIPAKAKYLFGKPGTLGWNTGGDVRNAKGNYPPRTLDPAEARAVAFYSAIGANRAIWMQLLWLLGVIGLVIAAVRWNSAGIWSAALIVYWLLFHITLGNGQPRYLISVAPVVAVGAGYLIALGISAVSRRTKRASA